MNEIILVEDPAINYARATHQARQGYIYELAKASSLLPRAVVSNQSWEITVAQTFYIAEVGAMMGIHPIEALSGIHMIEGKWTISAGLMSALVRRKGHKLRVSESGDWEAGTYVATCVIIRKDDPEFEHVATFGHADAVRAGTLGKTNWKNYPKNMCKARAISACARQAAEDALGGAHYTPEELGASVNEAGEILVGEVVGDESSYSQPAQRYEQPAPAAAPEQPAERPSVRPVEEGVAPAGATAPTDSPAAEISDERILAAIPAVAIAHAHAMWEAAGNLDPDTMVAVWKSGREAKCLNAPAVVFNESGDPELYGRDEQGHPIALETMMRAEGARVREWVATAQPTSEPAPEPAAAPELAANEEIAEVVTDEPAPEGGE